MRTYSAKPGDVTQDWYVVDAADQVLGIGRAAAVPKHQDHPCVLDRLAERIDREMGLR